MSISNAIRPRFSVAEETGSISNEYWENPDATVVAALNPSIERRRSVLVRVIDDRVGVAATRNALSVRLRVDDAQTSLSRRSSARW